MQRPNTFDVLCIVNIIRIKKQTKNAFKKKKKNVHINICYCILLLRSARLKQSMNIYDYCFNQFFIAYAEKTRLLNVLSFI